MPDDRLWLIFTCWHPALPLEVRTALTLRTLAGLTTAEIARALLVSEPTRAKRIDRAKQRIRNARIAYRVPAPELTHERTTGMLVELYLLFNEGYSASTGASPGPVGPYQVQAAIAIAQGPIAGLVIVEALDTSGAPGDDHLLAATKADLLARLGRHGEAAVGYKATLELVGNDVERRFLSRPLTHVAGLTRAGATLVVNTAPFDETHRRTWAIYETLPDIEGICTRRGSATATIASPSSNGQATHSLPEQKTIAHSRIRCSTAT